VRLAIIRAGAAVRVDGDSDGDEGSAPARLGPHRRPEAFRTMGLRLGLQALRAQENITNTV